MGCLDILGKEELSKLQGAISRERWFGSKSRKVLSMDICDCTEESLGGTLFIHAILGFTFSDGGRELYQVPIAISEKHEGESNAWLTFTKDGRTYVAGDGLSRPGYLGRLLAAAKQGSGMRFQAGRMEFETTPEFERLEIGNRDVIRPMGREQSNSSFLIGRKAVYKCFRKLGSGVNPDFEMPRFIALRSRRKIVPMPLAHCRYTGDGDYSLGCLSEFIENEGDCWSYMTSRIALLIDSGARSPDSDLVNALRELAAVTSELHNTLSSGTGIADFEPELIVEEDIARWMTELETLRAEALESLRASMPLRNREAQLLAVDVLSLLERNARNAGNMRCMILPLSNGRKYKIRIHGDYHLGQVLKSANSFTLIDFEGEPAKSMEERRRRHCALRDVSGMLRSIDYACAYASRVRGADGAAAELSQLCQKIFIDAYWKDYSPACEYLPDTEKEAIQATGFFALEKAYYELSYELNNRPDWAGIPLNAILSNEGAGAGNC